jgi:small neutral amino acid transporter SnatA (MarC family)
MDLKCVNSWETSSNWKCMIKENKKDYKVYVQWTTVHVGVLFFVNRTICAVWYFSANSIKIMCGIIVVYVSLEFAVYIQWKTTRTSTCMREDLFPKFETCVL